METESSFMEEEEEEDEFPQETMAVLLWEWRNAQNSALVFLHGGTRNWRDEPIDNIWDYDWIGKGIRLLVFFPSFQEVEWSSKFVL